MTKFIEQYNTDDWEIETEHGFVSIKTIFKTIPYNICTIETETNKTLKCADTHSIINEFNEEVFIKDIILNKTKIKTKDGIETVIKKSISSKEESMFDIEIDDDLHCYYTNDILSHNTSTIGAICLHTAIFNSDKTVTIFANKGDTAREILNKITIGLENLPFFLQPGVCNYNKGSVDFDNGSRILTFATTSSSARSYTSSLVYLDEFAWVDNDVEFFTSVYPIISSGKTSKVIISSTPNGLNLFYKLWTDAKNKKNDFCPIEIFWWNVPGRDELWKQKTINNTSERQFEQEFSCKFLGSNGTLISSDIIDCLIYEEPIRVQNKHYKIYDSVERNHQYLLSVDVSRGTGNDYSAISVIDITTKPYIQSAIYYNNEISTMEFPETIINIASDYNMAYVLVENNDLGSQVLDELNFTYDYDNIVIIDRKPGIKTTKKTKLLGCIRFKELLQHNQLIIKNFDTIHEISCFVESKGSYAADKPTEHDDLVMTLVLFSWFEKSNYFEIIKDEHQDELTNEQIQNNDYFPPDIISSDVLTDEEQSMEEIAWLFK